MRKERAMGNFSGMIWSVARSVRWPALGMLFGLVAVAISAVLVFYFAPRLTGERLPLRAVSGAWITLRFPDDSPVAQESRTHLQRLERELSALAGTLGIQREALPPRVNVFLHNNELELRSIRAQRTEILFPAAVDIIYGEDARVPFIQLIGDFAVGKNRSRLLRYGIIEYIRAPEQNHHLPVAALPEELQLNLEELLLFEGRFPLTRYQLFNSPHAAARIVGLEGIAQLAELERRVDPDLMNMAVSFVAFLSERFGGPEQVIKLWRAGSLDANLWAVYGHGLAEINRMWRDAVAAVGPQDEGWALARGRGLIRVGRFDEAFSLLQFAYEEHRAGGVPVGAIAREIGWINLLAGEWEEAKRQFLQAQTTGIDPSHELRLAAFYSDWETAEAGAVRIHRAPNLSGGESASLREWAIALDADLQRMQERLAIDTTGFPERTILFLGASGEEGIATDLRAGIVAVASKQELDRSLAKLIAFHLWRDQTLSPVLRAGLIRYLVTPQEDHLGQLRDLALTEAWIPLHLLDFANFPARYVEPQAAGIVAHLLENYGMEKFHALWRITSPLGGRRSLDTAMSIIYGFTRRGLDEKLRPSVF